MRSEVTVAIEELKRQFTSASSTVSVDGNGGAYVILEPVLLSPRYTPRETWLGFHIPPTYPYADIYPVFMGNEVSRLDGRPFEAPVTRGHTFQGRSAIQISRRNGTADAGLQKATTKILKILHFLEHMP